MQVSKLWNMAPDLRIISPALVSLLLVLAAITAMIANVPTGLPVAVPRREALPPSVLCVEQRLIIVRVEADGALYINSEPTTRTSLTPRLEEIFRTRAERVAFVFGSPQVTFGDVAGVISIMRRTVSNVGILTPTTVPTMAEPLLRGAFPLKTRW